MQSRGFNRLHVDMAPKILNRTNKDGSNLGSQDCPLFLPKEYEVVLVSRTYYDPLFGFSGAPTVLLRHYLRDSMIAAFESRRSNLPAPGDHGPPLSVALSASNKLSATSVELVSTMSYCDAFRKAIEKLSSTTANEVDCVKSAIVAGSDGGDFSDLATSLNLCM